MTLTRAGSPYVADGGATIASGATVTVEPGALVKTGRFLTDSQRLIVRGGLYVRASKANPAVFTSYRDTAAGQWGGIEYKAASRGSVTGALIRYAGRGIDGALLTEASIPIADSTFRSNASGGVAVKGGSPTIRGSHFAQNFRGILVMAPGDPLIANNTIEQSTDTGIDYLDYSLFPTQATVRVQSNIIRRGAGGGIRVAGPTGYGFAGGEVQGNRVENNAGKALEFRSYGGARNFPLPGEVNQNTARGNGCDCVWLDNVSVRSNQRWRPGLTFVLARELNVASTLTLEGGVVIKGTGDWVSRLQVQDGDLRTQGTRSNPVVFTSFKDDAYGGDTNRDGSASQPARGDWGGITVTGQATIAGARLTYGGAYSCCGADYAMLTLPRDGPGAPTTVRGSLLAHSANAAIYVGNFARALPTIERNSFRGNAFAISKSFEDRRTLRAPYNSFGCDSGPRRAGCGDWVDGRVDYTPFTSEEQFDGECMGIIFLCPWGAEPVVLSTGAFTHTHTDLRLTGKSNPLEFTRTYNSRDSADASVGKGWSHSGLMSASTLETGDVVVRRLDGRRDTFTKVGQAYRSPPGIHDTLTQGADSTYTLATPEETTYRFDQSGRIAQIIDDHGQATIYSYDQDRRLSFIEDPSNQRLSFSYDDTNHITQVSDSAGRSVRFAYERGNLTQVSDPLGGVTRYLYDARGRLSAITDPNEVTFLQNTYDAQDRVVSQEDGENNIWRLSYRPGEAQVQEPEGGQITYSFDSRLRLSARRDQTGELTSYAYDQAGNLERVVRPGGSQTTFAYDARGNLTRATYPEGKERAFAYDSRNHPTRLTDARGGSWSFSWSPRNDLTRITDPKEGETTLTYDQAGLPLTVTDPNRHTTTFAYDGRGNLTSRRDPLRNETAFTYDRYNYLASLTEPGKDAATYEHNALGDLTATADPDGATTFFGYDANGELTSITDAEGATWQIERNTMERITALTDPTGARTEIAYDKNLNPVLVVDRLGNETAYAYDRANRLSEIARPTGSVRFAYDARGNLREKTDPRGSTTTYAYDLLDRLTRLTEPESTTTSYAYDREDNLTSQSDPRGNRTAFTYDELDQLIRITQPLGKETSFTYDGAGNLKTRVTQVDTLAFNYDDADRLTAISKGDEPMRTFAYDGAGRLTEADAGEEMLALGYDQEDRVTWIEDGWGRTVERAYDPRGNLIFQTDARGSLSFTYDELKRLTSLTNPQGQSHAFTYDREGNLLTQQRPNGATTEMSYDPDGRILSTRSLRQQTTLEDIRYTYDEDGNRLSKTDRLDQRTEYTYDELGRLTSITDPEGQTTEYGYDRAGNRTRAGQTTYTYDELNQLRSASDGTSYSYDRAGRLSRKSRGGEITTYRFDPFDELLEANTPQGSTTYTYDALGRRRAKTQAGRSEIASYGDLSDNPIFDQDEAGRLLKSYIEGPMGLIEERAGGQSAYPLADAHGDIVALTDPSGQVSARQSYDPWGVRTSGPEREFGYLGAYLRRADSELGTIQMGARQYEPGLGRFLSEDPIYGQLGLGQSLNLYAYALDNPLTYLDLSGMFFEELWKEWVVPAGITLRNFTVPDHWHELYADWKEGLKQLPRSLQAADKALLQSVGDLVSSCYNAEVLKCGSWFVPGGVLKGGKFGTKLGKAVKGGRKLDITEVDRIAKDVKLTRGQRRLLHDEIYKQNFELDEIKAIAEQIKQLHPNK